jgi:hypothetical protein
MRDRHWKMLMQTTGKHFTMDEKFCLGDLLALELHNYVDACRCAALPSLLQCHVQQLPTLITTQNACSCMWMML